MMKLVIKLIVLLLVSFAAY
ncbi:type I toxin-antitoxin system Ibs family toxin [Escherichia coli]|uniref:Type I toxin-antitoxin system Ibs family toxin n=1 Tax=Escherichia coli TaxID=562 RepID=A0A8S7BCN7_ECOLX|nr:type I toxin-antitoxin system Ibs family toxin [Escherichia coli]EEV6079442.1 type I toxin-antitoxin system Ibs family toxin [Escherichia coli]EEV6137338.1 type I toxin-antitoxin system Ibs family toxin [Escherichia coli]EEZ5269922.1 type I toxin-antitoxin system Ibs family toxin [Escherichia coli]EFA2986641.1 type I toxin-antitoxin system Ibs family toxin [Escherichia coli]EFA2994849.1 type I toxin-antitoxin system Ibs family toxin [Escherichia coli]